MNRSNRQNRSFFFTGVLVVCGLLCTISAFAPQVQAQSVTKRPMPAGGVTGLELALDGATRAPLGGSTASTAFWGGSGSRGR